MLAKIRSILRPDVFRIELDSSQETVMLLDRRIMFFIKNFENKEVLQHKILQITGNKFVNLERIKNLPSGIMTGRIYIDGKHLSYYLR